jgi:Double zinc ribbon/Adenylate and Guanylate cyclase catalytic domain
VPGVEVCVSCGHENASGGRFCGNCGAALLQTCPSCGFRTEPGNRFCPGCGSPLSEKQGSVASPSTAGGQEQIDRASSPSESRLSIPEAEPLTREERRLVTALFCDLVGFTPLSERLDPEDVRDIQGEYFEAMSGQVERYGGTVEKYAGDAVLALFGTPTAHEDDAERAVVCVLGMQ